MMRFLLATLILCATSAAHAQSVSTGLERELSLKISPANPAPSQSVQLSISSFAIDLDRSLVIWYANNKEFARGMGLSGTALVVGAGGSETRIRVIAEDESGIVATAETTIRPAEVDLLWEADSYVPPFYAGRILPGGSSNIRAQALARFQKAGGTLVPESDIVYTWYRSDAKITSGRGKSAASLPGPTLFGADTIRVVAESADHAYKAEASARIAAVDPFVMLYENHPLFGVLYHRALDGGAETLETELKLSAAPYFARASSPRETGLTYTWRVDDVAINPDPAAPEILTITTNGFEGPMDIVLELTHLNDITMRATGAWRLIFGGTGLFGTIGVSNPFGGQ